MTSYTIGITNISNIAAKISSLNSRIPVNLEILTTLTDIQYDSLESTLTFTFSSPLPEEETIIFDDLIRIIVEEEPTEYIYVRPRIIKTTRTPVPLDDYHNGYVVGCIAVNTATDFQYICVDSTSTAAIWNQFTLPQGLTGQYLTYNGSNWEATSVNPGPTGSTGPTGPRGYSEINALYFSNTGPFTSFSDTTFKSVNNFYFAGTNLYGASPVELAILANTDNGTGSFAVQIVDITTSGTGTAVVAGFTGLGIPSFNQSPQIYTTNTFNNVSATPTVWEFQILGKGSVNNSSTNLYSSHIHLA